jgi:hypothetical protein
LTAGMSVIAVASRDTRDSSGLRLFIFHCSGRHGWPRPPQQFGAGDRGSHSPSPNCPVAPVSHGAIVSAPLPSLQANQDNWGGRAFVLPATRDAGPPTVGIIGLPSSPECVMASARSWRKHNQTASSPTPQPGNASDNSLPLESVSQCVTLADKTDPCFFHFFPV